MDIHYICNTNLKSINKFTAVTETILLILGRSMITNRK